MPNLHAQQFSSGPDAVAVVELYTSQGCSSCPPAEKWLSGLVDEPGLWSQFIPLAWHVDYWDYLGWRDVFSDPAYTARQRQYDAAGRVSQVYTPAVIRDGAEWRQWRWAPVRLASDRRALGVLQMERADERALIRFTPGANGPTGRLRAHLARLGVGYQTDIARGENSGRRLDQDFVVLGHSSAPVTDGAASLPLPPLRGPAPARQALVAWISEGQDPAPLQATGGWIDGDSETP